MNESKLIHYVTVYNNERFEETILPQPLGGGGGTLGIFGWGCAPVTPELLAYARAA